MLIPAFLLQTQVVVHRAAPDLNESLTHAVTEGTLNESLPHAVAEGTLEECEADWSFDVSQCFVLRSESGTLVSLLTFEAVCEMTARRHTSSDRKRRRSRKASTHCVWDNTDSEPGEISTQHVCAHLHTTHTHTRKHTHAPPFYYVPNSTFHNPFRDTLSIKDGDLYIFVLFCLSLLSFPTRQPPQSKAQITQQLGPLKQQQMEDLCFHATGL